MGYTWQFFVTFLEWLSYPFQGCEPDLQVGDKRSQIESPGTLGPQNQ